MARILLVCLIFTFRASRSFLVGPRTVRWTTQPLRATAQPSTPTELPDSLEDAAERAAEATASFAEQSGPLARCRVDFDTSVGDETYTILKSSTEFMQYFTSALCYAVVPGLQQKKQDEMMKTVQARAELKSLFKDNPEDDRIPELQRIVNSQGRDPEEKWEGPVARVYFPDEGSAALARRDWLNPNDPKVPPCVEFSSCGGIQLSDVSNDALVFFFCPKASESESVEEILRKTEMSSGNLKLTVFVNPNLVDMGVTGFGMAGRMLRERLIDPLVNTYYLRTLQWGALTRLWPSEFSVWQEDAESEGGYKLIKSLDTLPSNPEVEDIYDIYNGDKKERQSGGMLDQLGDFVNGMMRL